MTTPDPALAVTDLAKSFDGFRAVDGVTFQVAEAEIVALIGPNGAGKTTTFNLVNGQLHPDRGRVAVGGRDVTGHDAAEEALRISARIGHPPTLARPRCGEPKCTPSVDRVNRNRWTRVVLAWHRP